MSTEPTKIAIAANGHTLAADAFGEADRTPVVLLHGGGQTRHAWRSTGATLALAGWHVISVDMRGHGDSDWSADGHYDLDLFADDVVAITHHLGRPPVLVGASLGGNASLAALGQDPQLAIGLVLVDVSPFINRQGTNRIGQFMMANPEGFASVDEAADAVARFLPHRPRPHSLDGLLKNLRQVDGRYFWHWDPAFITGRSGTGTEDDLLDFERLSAAALSLRIPTLLVRGGQSEVLTTDDARRFLELVPHAEFDDVAEAHHMVAGDDNAAFDDVLRGFLDRRIRARSVTASSSRHSLK